jgi:23S rRNA maturation-related 3'-5' exoribonuclease YhaM
MNHETKLQQIELEMTEMKSQILKLEFRHKKDIMEAEKNTAEAEKRFNERDEKIQRQLDYVAKLAGITYEELDLLDEKIIRSGQVAVSPRKRV